MNKWDVFENDVIYKRKQSKLNENTAFNLYTFTVKHRPQAVDEMRTSFISSPEFSSLYQKLQQNVNFSPINIVIIWGFYLIFDFTIPDKNHSISVNTKLIMSTRTMSSSDPSISSNNKIIFMVCYGVLTLIGSFGNIVSILCLRKKNHVRKNKLDSILLSLSINDALMSTVGFPLTAWNFHFSSNEYTKARIFCALYLSSVSSLTIM